MGKGCPLNANVNPGWLRIQNWIWRWNLTHSFSVKTDTIIAVCGSIWAVAIIFNYQLWTEVVVNLWTELWTRSCRKITFPTLVIRIRTTMEAMRCIVCATTVCKVPYLPGGRGWAGAETVPDTEDDSGSSKRPAPSVQAGSKYSSHLGQETTFPGWAIKHCTCLPWLYINYITTCQKFNSSAERAFSVLVSTRGVTVHWSHGSVRVRYNGKQKTKMQKALAIRYYCVCLRLYHLVSYSLSPEMAATAWTVKSKILTVNNKYPTSQHVLFMKVQSTQNWRISIGGCGSVRCGLVE